ncbi:hypothetical protein E2C01_037922 [Portunus trituberculatus]|uniref:Uncharacterized protein n=1 Tax=Portunus trituberculatus TaxID=210409 RepID=A0A5B7FCS5_PORTR|nr:hypothetical protein [Portunus trituberculatus]
MSSLSLRGCKPLAGPRSQPRVDRDRPQPEYGTPPDAICIRDCGLGGRCVRPNLCICASGDISRVCNGSGRNGKNGRHHGRNGIGRHGGRGSIDGVNVGKIPLDQEASTEHQEATEGEAAASVVEWCTLEEETGKVSVAETRKGTQVMAEWGGWSWSERDRQVKVITLGERCTVSPSYTVLRYTVHSQLRCLVIFTIRFDLR